MARKEAKTEKEPVTAGSVIRVKNTLPQAVSTYLFQTKDDGSKEVVRVTIPKYGVRTVSPDEVTDIFKKQATTGSLRIVSGSL